MCLTAKRLRELLAYNPRTGHFTWMVNLRGRCARIGVRAGALRKDGRTQIRVDGCLYLANRLAVLWMTGKWPKLFVDHRNLNRSDNRWSNLREASPSQNGANSHDRKSGVPLKGVTFVRPKGTRRPAKPYIARIKVNYRSAHLGCFDTSAAAHAAYASAARHHFGEFARRQ